MSEVAQEEEKGRIKICRGRGIERGQTGFC